MSTKSLINILLIVFAFFTLVISFKSCEGRANEKSYDLGDNYPSAWGSIEYKIEQKRIDSCEYIIIFGVEGRSIIHKANCDNH